jgi:hypothetical protein
MRLFWACALLPGLVLAQARAPSKQTNAITGASPDMTKRAEMSFHDVERL